MSGPIFVTSFEVSFKDFVALTAKLKNTGRNIWLIDALKLNDCQSKAILARHLKNVTFLAFVQAVRLTVNLMHNKSLNSPSNVYCW